MWLYTGIIASIFCLLASAGLAITSWSDAGPGLVVFALLTLFWAKMLFTMLRQVRNPEADPNREPALGMESQPDSGAEPELDSETKPKAEQKSLQGARSYAEPAGNPTFFVPHWFLMGAIILTALLVCLAIIVPLLVK